MSTDETPATDPGQSEFVPPPELASAYDKLRWTGICRDQTRQAYDHFFTVLRPYRIEAHPRPSDKAMDFTIHAVEGATSHIPLVAMTADTIHNARCVLDHLAYALAKLQTPGANEKQLFGVTFPIVADEKDWKPEGRLKLLDESTQDQIAKLQIFANEGGGYAMYVREGLYRVSELDRRDRHRELNVALMGTDKINFPTLDPPYKIADGGGMVSYGPLRLDGRDFATLYFESEAPSELPSGLDPYDAFPLALVFTDMTLGNFDARPGKIYMPDLINTVYWAYESVGAVLQWFTPLFRGEPMQPLFELPEDMPEEGTTGPE